MRDSSKVLVVENDAKIRDVIGIYLKKEGFNVLQTDNGIEALSIIKKEKPGLIILDIMLPGLSGYEVCKRIKTNEETKNTIIVILSAIGQDSTSIKRYQVEADLYETKPFSPKSFVNNIKKIINKKGNL
ncbi:MAG: response regulator [Candidatus Helarchaeota archaeon]|nr:response regulator [Candidatus Helarchaeota archaeon]